MKARRRAAEGDLGRPLKTFGAPATIPKGWLVSTIGEVSECLDRLRRPVTESDRVHGDIPYYGANGQQGWIDSPIFEESLVLVAEDGGHFDDPDRGVAYRIDGPSWVNNHAHVLRPRPGVVEVEYLFRALQNYDFTPYISGTTRAKLTQGQMSGASILLPPLSTQRRIAEVLDRAEALRAKRRACLVLLDTLVQSLFLEMFGDPATNSKGWPQVRLAEVLADAKPGFACGEDPSDGVFQFRMNNVTTEGALDFSKKRRVPKSTRNLASFLVAPGDVLFNSTNSPDLVGKSAFFPGHDEPAVFSNHFLRLRARANKLDGRYLAQILAFLFQRRVFQNMCRQWVNQAAVGRDSLLALRIYLPPLALQHDFSRRVAAIERQKARLRASLAELDALFASLQDRAFRGELWPDEVAA